MSVNRDDRPYRPGDLSHPVLLGYQTTRLAAEPSEAAFKRRTLLKLAQRKGFRLGRIFEENDLNRPCSALASLIAEARAARVSVVAVPTVEDLGLQPHVQRVTRQRIEREAGVRVLIAG